MLKVFRHNASASFSQEEEHTKGVMGFVGANIYIKGGTNGFQGVQWFPN